MTQSADHDAPGWERGYRDAIDDLQAAYPYGDAPEWRIQGVEWLDRRLSERLRTRDIPPGEGTAR